MFFHNFHIFSEKQGERKSRLKLFFVKINSFCAKNSIFQKNLTKNLDYLLHLRYNIKW